MRNLRLHIPLHISALIIFLSLPLLPTASFAETETETYLRTTLVFEGLREAKNVEQWLKDYIERMKPLCGQPADSSALYWNQGDAYQKIGDAYHWLGHIEVDRKNYKQAHVYFDHSIRFYRESRFRISTRLAEEDGITHAIQHIAELHALQKMDSDLPEFATGHFALSAAENPLDRVPTSWFGWFNRPNKLYRRCRKILAERSEKLSTR